MATTRFWTGAIGAAAAAALLAGCAGEDSADAPMVAPVSSGTGTDLFAGGSGAAVMAAATRAMDGIQAVTLDIRFHAGGSYGSGGSQDTGDVGDAGDTADDSPSRLSAAVEYDRCAGSMEFGPQTVQFLLVSGERYLKGDAGFWTSDVGAPPAIGQELSRSWVKLPPPSPNDDDSSLDHFCNLQDMLDELDNSRDAGPATKGESTTFAGRTAWPVTEDDGTSTIRYYVAATGTPYILGLDDTEDGDTTAVAFSGFDKQPRITAPPASATLDLENYTHDPSFSI